MLLSRDLDILLFMNAMYVPVHVKTEGIRGLVSSFIHIHTYRDMIKKIKLDLSSILSLPESKHIGEIEVV